MNFSAKSPADLQQTPDDIFFNPFPFAIVPRSYLKNLPFRFIVIVAIASKQKRALLRRTRFCFEQERKGFLPLSPLRSSAGAFEARFLALSSSRITREHAVGFE